MSWKFVFNTNNMIGFNFLAGALTIARKCGFRFMLWDGEVLDTKYAEPTGITENDLF